MNYRYVGNGAFLHDIPARDLTDGDVANVAESLGVTVSEIERRIVESKIYQSVTSRRVVPVTLPAKDIEE